MERSQKLLSMVKSCFEQVRQTDSECDALACTWPSPTVAGHSENAIINRLINIADLNTERLSVSRTGKANERTNDNQPIRADVLNGANTEDLFEFFVWQKRPAPVALLRYEG